MPLTSVHISIEEAFSILAKIEAVKSEPPLPNVVFSPFSFRATNPGTRVIFAEELL